MLFFFNFCCWLLITTSNVTFVSIFCLNAIFLHNYGKFELLRYQVCEPELFSYSPQTYCIRHFELTLCDWNGPPSEGGQVSAGQSSLIYTDLCVPSIPGNLGLGAVSLKGICSCCNDCYHRTSQLSTS